MNTKQLMRRGLLTTMALTPFLSLFLTLFPATDASAQKKVIKETPLLRISYKDSQKDICEVSTVEEFEHMYAENVAQAPIPMSRQEYLQLFINYKLKAAEARAMGIDTSKAYEDELKFYIGELAQAYMTDTTALPRLKERERLRSREEIRASHILIGCAPGALPADTAAAYARCAEALQKVKDGTPFADVAAEYSSDPSGKHAGGDLGYFSAMHMVAAFEDAAYNTPVGQTSGIFRTRFGYHFLTVADRRPNEGDVLVEHIMCYVPRQAQPDVAAKAKTKIDSLYAALQQPGIDQQTAFEDMARQHSDDSNSAARGGMLPWFNRTQILPEFAQAAFALKQKGDISQPVRTQAGWHIIRLLDRRTEMPHGEFEAMAGRYISSIPIERDCATNNLLARLAKEYGFGWNQTALDSVVNIMLANKVKNTRTAALEKLCAAHPHMVLATFNGQSFDVKDIAQFCDKWTSDQIPAENITALRNAILDQYERAHLADKYADYRNTERGYSEGLLVYEVSLQRRVWNAVPDSATAAEIYKAFLPRYSKGGTFEGTIFFCATPKDAAKVKKLAEKGKTDKAMELALKAVSGTIRKGDIYDDVLWPCLPNSPYVVVWGNTTNGTPLPQKRCYGQIITDFQQQEDARLADELAKKYKVEILKKIK